MLYRKIYKEIESFYANNKKEALLLTGARQVGKSFVIREFGKKHFESFVEINFLENTDAATVFLGAQDAQDILLRLSVLAN